MKQRINQVPEKVDCYDMVTLAQLVRVPDCDSGGRGFEPHTLPKTLLVWHMRIMHRKVQAGKLV